MQLGGELIAFSEMQDRNCKEVLSLKGYRAAEFLNISFVWSHSFRALLRFALWTEVPCIMLAKGEMYEVFFYFLLI